MTQHPWKLGMVCLGAEPAMLATENVIGTKHAYTNITTDNGNKMEIDYHPN